MGRCAATTGTATAATPQTIAERLDVKTYLNKGLVIQFVDKSDKRRGEYSVEFRHEGGVADFLDAVNKTRADQRVGSLPFVLEREDDEWRIVGIQ